MIFRLAKPNTGKAIHQLKIKRKRRRETCNVNSPTTFLMNQLLKLYYLGAGKEENNINVLKKSIYLYSYL